MLHVIKKYLRNSLLRILREDKISRWKMLGATIGQNVFVGEDVIIDEGFACLLTIEDGVVISDRTIIALHDSAFNNVCGLPIKAGRVTIKQRAYIGINSVILCGVTIGQHVLLGAGSVVTKDIPDEVVAFGCPASVQGTLAEFSEHYRLAVAQTGRFQYWDIIPWRERKNSMSIREIEVSRQKFIDQFGNL